jgi:transposase InsO family protein
VTRKIVHLRRRKGLGPAMIAGRLGMHASTVHRVLVRERLSRLRDMDRATREPIRRYERSRPGELVHVDIKKLGNIPNGGGARIHGPAIGYRHRRETAKVRGHNWKPVIGYSFIHTAVDDHSRLAYSEVLADERGQTAADFWLWAAGYFAACGIRVERVLTDNGSSYRSFEWRDALLLTGAVHKRIRAYRPQTNGKVERFNRTLLAEWALPSPTAPNQPAGGPCQDGCTSTTITDHTPQSAGGHQPAAYLTCQGRTAKCRDRALPARR